MQKIQNCYAVEIGTSAATYEFVSVGKNGNITKIVQYLGTDVVNFYNLAFGDKTEFGEFDDVVISNNGDSEKVLTTVIATLYIFTDSNPNVFVFATGSTEARTRLYRIGIANNLDVLSKDFTVFGFLNEKWEIFECNKPYEGFLVKRKNK